MAKYKKAPGKPPEKKADDVPLIERIPSENVDLEKLALFCHTEYQSILSDRKEWEERRSVSFQDIDNFIHYYSDDDLPFEKASGLHVPVTLEKVRAVHARLYQALFGVKPPFYAEPQEDMDQQRLKSIYQLMRWAVSRFVNKYKGIQEEADGFLWNFASEGWGAMRLTWDRQFRKALVVNPVIEKPTKLFGKGGMPTELPPLRFKEETEWIPVFEGPIVENIQNEDFLMPGKGSVQAAPFIALKTALTAHELKFYAMTKYFDQTAVNKALDYPDSVGSYGAFQDDMK